MTSSLSYLKKKTDSENPRGLRVNEAATDNITKPLGMVEVEGQRASPDSERV